MLILLISISLIAYAFAGLCEAIFEGIWYYDSISYYFKKTANKVFWSRKAFYGIKDRNNDGIVSYWESTFICNGGHVIKFVKTFGLILASIGTILITKYSLKYAIFCVLFGLVIVKPKTFDIFLTIFKKKK